MTYDSLQFTVAEVTKMFNVSRDTVKTWAYRFSEYLSPGSNPPKGTVRKFKLEDIRIMAYVYTEWEDDPDIECIKIGLNRNNHFENPHIEDLINSLTPIFVEPSDIMDESWKHGVIFSGMATDADLLQIARSYKLAGDRLIEIALENEEAWDLHNPALFNYRHAIELYLKVLTNSKEQVHNLLPLFQKLKALLKAKYNSEPPPWFENIIVTFNDFDPGGTTFRYGENEPKDEVFIDFIQLKKRMGWLSTSFQNILTRDGITY